MQGTNYTHSLNWDEIEVKWRKKNTHEATRSVIVKERKEEQKQRKRRKTSEKD